MMENQSLSDDVSDESVELPSDEDDDDDRSLSTLLKDPGTGANPNPVDGSPVDETVASSLSFTWALRF